MAEVLGVVASGIAVAQTVDRVVSLLGPYIMQVEHAKEEVENLSAEVRDLGEVLKAVGRSAHGSSNKLDQEIKQCESTLKKIQSQPKQCSVMMSLVKALNGRLTFSGVADALNWASFANSLSKFAVKMGSSRRMLSLEKQRFMAPRRMRWRSWLTVAMAAPEPPKILVAQAYLSRRFEPPAYSTYLVDQTVTPHRPEGSSDRVRTVSSKSRGCLGAHQLVDTPFGKHALL